jgi:hemerythrin-like domain-containing protein
MTVADQPDLQPSYLEHRAMRVDAARLTTLVRSAEPTDAGRLREVAAWYDRYESAIHDHHTAEEAVIYPALLSRDPSFADADARLEGQHGVLADRLTVVRESLGGLVAAAGGSNWERERDESVRAAEALREIIVTHLAHEEDVAFSRYRAAFTGTEFAALGAAAWKIVGSRSVIFAAPWVLDHATPTERSELLAGQPLLLRVLYRLVLRPRYDRLTRPLRASVTLTHEIGPEV